MFVSGSPSFCLIKKRNETSRSHSIHNRCYSVYTVYMYVHVYAHACACSVQNGLFLHVTCIYDYVILCHCTLAAALYFEQSSCDELMEFKQIQMRAQPEESLKHNHSCTHQGHGHCFFTLVTGLCNYGYVLMIPPAAPSFESV